LVVSVVNVSELTVVSVRATLVASSRFAHILVKSRAYSAVPATAVACLSVIAEPVTVVAFLKLTIAVTWR
jgi:hypothetical protein